MMFARVNMHQLDQASPGVHGWTVRMFPKHILLSRFVTQRLAGKRCPVSEQACPSSE